MPDLPRWPDFFRIFRDEVLSINGRLSKDVVERAGTDANIIAAGMAAMADEVANQLTSVAAGVFIGSAEKQALDRIVFDRFGIRRKSASGSIGSVTFSLPVVNAAQFTILDGTLLQAVDGTQFATIGNVFFPAGTSTLVVPVRSVLAGVDQQAKIGTIVNILGTVAGAPSDMTVSNPLATAGASDDESDESFRGRAQAFLTTARRGVRSAIVQGALAVPGIVKASVFEVLDSLGRPARLVLLTVADQYTDQFAVYDVVPAAYQVQSQQLAATVFAGLDEYRAAGIYVQVTVAQVILQPIQLALSFVAGVDVDYVAALAKAAAVNYVNALAPGNNFEPAGLQAALAFVPGLLLTGREIASPLGIVVAKPLQVIRTSFNLVTALSTQTSLPLLIGTAADLYTRQIV
jgi:uncharacterized phage protein gp47/JayE